ncbi:hypothetical protein D3C79_900560 [compost metagenome]
MLRGRRWLQFAAQYQGQALAQFLIVQGKGGRLGHARHFADTRLHFTGGYLLARPVDQVLGTVGDVQKALVVQMSNITGVEPTVAQGLGTGFGQLPVGVHQGRRT